jgi:GDP-4-dehydro-6-deoxy-D-mannose reductase
MRKVALVTGARGFIGSHLVKMLQAEAWQVVGCYLEHMVDSFPNLSRVTFLQCDLRNGERVTHMLSEFKPSVVFHLAAQSFPTVSWEDPLFTMECNVLGSVNLLEGVRRMSTPPIFVAACSSAEYGNVDRRSIPVTENHPLLPLHPYGISKVCLDLLARQYFMSYTIPTVRLRLFNTTGPGKTNDAPSDFVRQLVRIKKGLQDPVLRVGNLSPYRAFLDVHDTARAFMLAAERGKPGEVYNVCGLRTYQMEKILRMAMRLAEVNPKIKPKAELLRPKDEKIIFGNTKKFRKDTGWKPLIALEDTLKNMIDYWQRVS